MGVKPHEWAGIALAILASVALTWRVEDTWMKVLSPLLIAATYLLGFRHGMDSMKGIAKQQIEAAFEALERSLMHAEEAGILKIRMISHGETVREVWAETKEGEE